MRKKEEFFDCDIANSPYYAWEINGNMLDITYIEEI